MSVEGPSTVPPMQDNLYESLVAQTRQQHRLFSVHWELTYRCNQRCSHCYLDVLPPNADASGELTTPECLRVVDELAALGALNLSLSGGEIFVRRDLFEIAEYARSRRFLLRLFTNGIRITPRIADQIAALHPYAVEISLYGANAETHQKITRRAHSFELTTRAFRLLRERGVRTVMKTPLMHDNIHEFHALKSLAASLGAQFRYDITITPKDTGSTEPLQHRLTYDDLVGLFREVLKPDVWVKRTLAPDHHTCAIAANALVIDPYGTVFPCVQTRIAAGSTRKQPLQTIWETSPLWNDLRRLALSQLPVCRTCELRTLCVRCHGLAMVEDSDLRAPARANCREALARRQVLVEKGALPADYPVPVHLRELTDLQVSEFLHIKVGDRDMAAH